MLRSGVLAVALMLASGCLGHAPVATIEWLEVPGQVKAGEQFRGSYEVKRVGTMGHDGGFANATGLNVWATAGDADPATLQHYAIDTSVVPGWADPESCVQEDGVERMAGCTQIDLLVLHDPGAYWLRARAIVDGVETWSDAVRVVVT